MADDKAVVTATDEVTQKTSEVEKDQANAARREALKRLGVLGAITAPLMLTLLSTNAAAQAATSGATN
jgi:hypothetical protein